MSEKEQARWMARNFPSQHARMKADEAVDQLDVSEPMTRYLDVWIAAYIRAGGKTPLKFS